DDSHITEVLTPFFEDIIVPTYAQGFSEGFEWAGAMLDGFDWSKVAGRVYYRQRVVGAPKRAIWGERPPAKLPRAGKLPPRFVFTLLVKLHPALRRRARRCAEFWATRPWHDLARRWREELRPAA